MILPEFWPPFQGSIPYAFSQCVALGWLGLPFQGDEHSNIGHAQFDARANSGRIDKRQPLSKCHSPYRAPAYIVWFPRRCPPDSFFPPPGQSSTRRRRRAFAITLTELTLMAAPAIIGLSTHPKSGYSTPAASGTPSAL